MDNLIQIPEEILTVIEANFFALSLVAIILYAFCAFYGYRIFKFSMKFISAVALGVVGANLVAPLVTEALGTATVGPVSLSALIGLLFAVVGFVIAVYVYKLALFLLGAGAGFLAGELVTDILVSSGVLADFFASDAGYWVACGVCALVLGLLCAFLFKPLFIVISSIGSMFCVFSVVAVLLFSAETVTGIIALIPAILAVIVGIVAAVKQFKAEE